MLKEASLCVFRIRVNLPTYNKDHYELDNGEDIHQEKTHNQVFNIVRYNY